MESCQSREVQRRGKAIRGRGEEAVCVRQGGGAGGGVIKTAGQNEKS